MTAAQSRSKIIGVPLEKSINRTEKGTLLVRGYFTSDRQDETGDIITRIATEKALPKFKQWGNIRAMHQPLPVAKVLRIGAADGLDWNEVEIEVVDPDAIFRVENGLYKALSVGIFMSMDDLEFMDTGGIKINDYTLAEISLVDHPANYDAFLRSMAPSESLRSMVRAFGLDAVASSMMEILETKENAVMDETEQIKTVAEAPVEPATPVEAEKDITGEDLTPPVEDAAAEAPVSNPVVEEKAVEPSADMIAQIVESVVKAISEQITQAFERYMPTALKAAQPDNDAAVAEAHEEQPTGSPADKAIDADAEPGEPVNRTASLPTTGLAAEKGIDDEPRATDLREALYRYLTTRQ